jgi:hypothetical protein
VGAIQRLDLVLLVNRQRHRVTRRIDVEPDDLVQLLGEARIVRQLELPHAVRLQAVMAAEAEVRSAFRCARLVAVRVGLSAQFDLDDPLGSHSGVTIQPPFR